MGYGTLKDFVKQLRACKTQAQERALINKESAFLRTCFKQESSLTLGFRVQNITKLLYIYMLGYPVHFGQMECLKLIASQKYVDKRLGYLGISILIDEKQEVLTLVTNSLKYDLQSDNIFISSLAIITLSFVASNETALDLTDEIEKLVEHKNAYLRKKAALCALKLVKRAPELSENFVGLCLKLLNEKAHGVLLTATSLAIEIINADSGHLEKFNHMLEMLVKRLKTLSTNSTFLPELDVSGITDPFLQVKLMKLIVLLTKNNTTQEINEEVSNMLTQVGTNTESSRNVGNAILYETVSSIFEINSDQDLQIMGVNILGKFLKNKDKNIRYIALEMLLKTSAICNIATIQRYKNTILECLDDKDLYIQKRALELSFVIIDHSNIRIVTRKILAFLEKCDQSLKYKVAIQLIDAANRFALNPRWHVDTMICMMKMIGSIKSDKIVTSAAFVISSATDMQLYSTRKLYALSKSYDSKESLVLLILWVMGEYGSLLVKNGEFECEEITYQPSEYEILNIIKDCHYQYYLNTDITKYFMNACSKLCVKFPGLKAEILPSIVEYTYDFDSEVQQRAIEYSELLTNYNSLTGILSEIPPVKSTTNYTYTKDLDTDTPDNQTNAERSLMDIIGLDSELPESVSKKNISHRVTPNTIPDGRNALDSILDTFSSVSVSQKLSKEAVVYDKHSIKIVFQSKQDSVNSTSIVSTFYNTGPKAMSQLVFQAAVPKNQKIQLFPCSSQEITPGDSVNQKMIVQNSTNAPIKIRIKLSFFNGETLIEDLFVAKDIFSSA